MHILLPQWLSHGQGGHSGGGVGGAATPSALRSAPQHTPVFSVDIQPFGERLLTAGQDAAVCVWALPALAHAAVRQRRDGEQPRRDPDPDPVDHRRNGPGDHAADTAPRRLAAAAAEEAKVKAQAAATPPNGALLARVTGHSAAVNCVRWSPRGDLFASGGDDAVVLICERGEGGARSRAFGGGGGGEDWRVRKPLRGHSADVTDVCWSPDGERIASASVDNTIGIWSVRGEVMVAQLRGHAGLVKGVAWDPVGRFLASQSDDRSCIVWRTADWGQEVVLKDAFENAVFTANANVYFQRCSWSPCGTQLLTTNGVKRPNADVAPMYTRESGFGDSVDLVGHPKPVVATRFSPRLYRRKSPNSGGSNNNVSSTSSKEKPPAYTCLALGSKDGTISIWQALAKRPFVCLKDVFHHDCIDVSWGSDGYQLVACSSDGEVMYARFTADELGATVAYDEERQLLADMWRKFGASSADAHIVETPGQLALERAARARADGDASPVHSPAIASMAVADRAARGASVPQPAQQQERDPHAVHHRVQPPAEQQQQDAVAPVRGPTSASTVAPTPPANAELLASQREGRARSGKRRIIPAAVSTGSPGGVSDGASLLNSNSLSVPVPAPVERGLSGAQAEGNARPSKRARDSAGGVALLNGHGNRGGGSGGGGYGDDGRAFAAGRGEQGLVGAVEVPPPPIYRPSVVGLNMMLLPSDGGNGASSRCRAIDSNSPPTLLEVREQHGSSRGGGFMVSVSCGGEVQWRDYYPVASPIALLAGVAGKFAAVGTANGLLTFYSAVSGRRLTPPIALDCAPHLLEAYVLPCACTGPTGKGVATSEHINGGSGGRATGKSAAEGENWFSLVVTRSGLCSVFDVRQKKLLCARSAAPLLAKPIDAKGFAADTDDSATRAEVFRTIAKGRVTNLGEPLLVLSDGNAFFYSRDLCSWLLIADDSVPNSEFVRSVPVAPSRAGIVRSLQASAASSRRPPTLSGMGDLRRAAVETLAHLETLLESSVALASPEDYRYYLTNYAAKLSTAADDDVENSDRRLRELCDSLLRVDAKSPEECLVLGMDSRDLLQNVVLAVVSSKTSMQRLVSEYMDSLKELSSRMTIT